MTISGLKWHQINVFKYSPIIRKRYIESPQNVSHKKGLLNIKNKNENKCFMWCHIASLFPVPINKSRLLKYINHENDVDYTGITFQLV